MPLWGVSRLGERQKGKRAGCQETLQRSAIMGLARANSRHDSFLPIVPFTCFESGEVTQARIAAVCGDYKRGRHEAPVVAVKP